MSARALSLDDESEVSAWCERYGVTAEQLTLATRMVGRMPAALHFYFTSRGRPTKIVTDEMRASRAPIRPRDRRRKSGSAAANDDREAAPSSDLEALRIERSKRELDLHIASDRLHEHLCPTTIRAYDEAQKRLEETSAQLERLERSTPARSRSATASR